jgi:DNA polymerase-3 subunit gamma/tau
MWPAVLDVVKSYSRVAWLTFDGSRPVSLANGVLAVGLENIGKVNSLKASGHDERLRQAILDVMKTDVRIDVILAPGGGTPSALAAAREGAASAAPSAPDAPAATVVPAEADAPSLDDANADSAVGVDLALRELGATQIGEIEH